jgi:Tfp pilus assembly protein PilZ
VSLSARRYPELVPFVSGVYYGEQDTASEGEPALGGELGVVSAGGPEVGPFAVTVAAPLELPLATATPTAAGLEVRWPAASEAEGVRIDVRGARGDGARSLSCAVADDGLQVIGGASLAELGTRELSVSVARVRRQPFIAAGVSGGEVLVVARDVAEVTLPEAPRAAGRGAPLPRTTRSDGAPRRAAPPARPSRKHERKQVELPVVLVDEANRVKGKIRFDSKDLSVGGAFLRSDLLFEVGEELRIEFALPAGPKVRARGKVVRVSRERDAGLAPGMGVEFTELSESDREAVRAFIAAG